MYYCRPPDDYLPHPESALLTGICPKTTQELGLAERDFAANIRQQFSQQNTCVVGYNNIRFDDEFTRYLFYRNFHDPYEHNWKNGNSRWDIIDLARAAYALRPSGIKWPKDEQGLPSFRLELLTLANGISHDNAHDASADVYATVALAKLLKQSAPKLWKYYLRLQDKRHASLAMPLLEPLVHISAMFGPARGNTSVVAPIMWHSTNKNAVVAVDLLQDISPLLELPADKIHKFLYTKKSKLGEQLPIPLKLIHTNKCPFVAKINTLTADNIQHLEIDTDLWQRNLTTLKNTPQINSKINQVFQMPSIFADKNNVDEMLYSGFFADGDKNEMKKIHAMDASQLAAGGLRVADNRFGQLLFRYRARNFPQSLTAAEKAKWNEHRRDYFASKSADYFAEIAEYKAKHKDQPDKSKLLNEMEDYANSLIASAK